METRLEHQRGIRRKHQEGWSSTYMGWGVSFLWIALIALLMSAGGMMISIVTNI